MKPLDELPYLEWTNSDNVPQRIYPDNVQSYDLTLDAIATAHPVETGESIVDHYRPEPRVLTVEMLFSDRPLRADLSSSPAPTKTGGLALQYQQTQKRLQKVIKLQYGETPRSFVPSLGNAISTVGRLLGAGALPDTITVPESPTPSRMPDTLETLVFATAQKRGLEAFSVIEEIRALGKSVAISTQFGLIADLLIVNCSLKRNVDLGDLTSVTMTLREIRTASAEIVPLERRAQSAQARKGPVALEEVTVTPRSRSILARSFGVTE